MTETTKPCCAPARASSDCTGSAALAGSGEGASPIAQAAAQARMAQIPGGAYRVGSDESTGFAADGEGPAREITLDTFEIAATAVTNREFAAFVDATGYRTDAERIGCSFVFHLFVPPRVARKVRRRVAQAPWWWEVSGASWREPSGPGSHVRDRQDHPVVHVSWNDAASYCVWAPARLPSEAEWEVAARGGLHGARYPWGDELTPNGRYMCNIWQGKFPERNTAEDGFIGTCPVRSFPSNGYGLYEVAGNVWEWCADWFDADAARSSPRHDPRGPTAGTARVIRGGSFLCHESYCDRYRVAARTSNTPDSSASNIGFRCARASVPG